MNWVKKRKLLAIEAIQYNRQPYIKLNDLWNALHGSFNSAQSRQLDIDLLDEIPDEKKYTWFLFSKEKLKHTIEKCNNLSVLGLDKLSWRHIKMIIRNKKCSSKLIDIANTYINLGHWPSHFKTSTMIVIPKPNKSSYDSSKSFHSIILLNTIGKLFKKMIGERLWFHLISNNFIHPCQLDRLKHQSMTDVGIALTYFIQSKWVKNLSTNMLAYDITQFFPSLNHHLLPLILDKVGFDLKVLIFFKNYLVGRKMKYLWNNFSSPSCNGDASISQSSALSSFYLLYISPWFFIFWKNI